VAEGRPERPPGYFIRLLVLPSANNCGLPENFVVGETIRLTVGMRVHSEANLDALVLHVAEQEARVTVVGGPVCANNYNWYRSARRRFDGWAWAVEAM
jgi:hypothetical protein